MTNAIPDPARYEPRKWAESKVSNPYGVWDTFTQSFVIGEPATTWAGAVTASARLNRAYREALAP